MEDAVKKERGRKKLALWLGLFSIIYALAGQTVHAGPPVDFRLVKNSLVVIPVRVNEEGPFDFLLDTGTNVTLVTPALARRLDLSATSQVSLITLAGPELVPRSVLDNVALGTKSTKQLEVLFDDLLGVRSLDAKICGVLGQNFLSQFNYLLNYRERHLEFETEGEMARRLAGTRLAVEQHEGKLIVSSQATTPLEAALRLVLDSGASHLVIFAAASGKLSLEPELRAGTLIPTSAAGQPIKLGRLTRLRIGSECIVNLPVALIEDRALHENRPEDGLLPTSLFHSIFFQNDKRIVILNPRAD